MAAMPWRPARGTHSGRNLALKRPPPRTWPTAVALACASLNLPLAAQTARSAADPAAPASTASASSANTEKVEIRAARFRDQAGKSSLSGEELARVPGAGGDPMKAIQSLPGVAVVDDASGDPAVRGSRPSDNAYFVDFLPVGYLFHLGGFASVFNPDLIRRFSLSSAAWSPEYGNAVGAVFDVALRNPRTDRLAGQADISLLGANALVEGPIGDNISFFLAARRSWFDLLTKTAEDKEEGVTYTVPVYSDAQGRLLWTVNARNRLRLDFSTADDRVDFTVKAGSKAAARDPIIAGSSTSKQSFTSVAAVWETDIGKDLSNKVALGQMQRRETFRLGGAGSVTLNNDISYLRQQLLLTTLKNHEITLGGSLQSKLVNVDLDFNVPRCTEFDPNCDISSAPRLVSKQESRQNMADLYVNDRWQFSPRWTATAGLRFSRDAYLRESRAEPRLGLEYNWSKDTVINAGWGRHSQAPDLDQSIAQIGNPLIKSLVATHVVLGVTQTLSPGWNWRAEAYAKRFDNYAVADPVLNYRNGASGTAQGLELLVRKEAVAGSRLSGFASLSLSRARRTIDATGEQFPFEFDQPVIATVVGQYKLSDRWQLGARFSYHTGSPYTPVVGTGLYPDGRVRPVFGPVNSQRVPAYHRLDLRADARFSPRLTAYVELINAYARKNVSGYSYSADYRTREEIQQLPLFPSFGVKYQF